VEFQRDVRPILAGHCFKCHGPAEQKRGLRLDRPSEASRNRVLVPGKPDASKLVRRILAEDEERMPPPAAGERLKPDQIATLKRWVAQGAAYTPHWAFVRPGQTPPSAVRDGGWPRNPIDHFLLARLEKEGLRPSPEAARATLIRRLSLDLLGLLPTPEDVETFVHDPRPDAYEQLVDRFLASPHYGERQARHWLDLARYADSNGYTIDGPRSIWPYRDWVIAALNADLSFDRFTVEQLAGDLLPAAGRDELVATGFHRNTPFNEEGGTNPEQFRVERTVDRTNTTGTVWLGLTVGCAQCHDHKFDPISQQEYYRLYAFFNPTDEPALPLPTASQEQRLRKLQAELAQVKAAPSPSPSQPVKDLAPLRAELEQETNGGWRILYPKMATSERGAALTALEDRSVLAAGSVAPSDSYFIYAVAPETGTVTAVRLEAVTHADLPEKGPGRSADGNFLLRQLVFETDGIPHRFVRGVADYEEKGHGISTTLDDHGTSGWSVGSSDAKERNVTRQAVFVLDKPHPVREGQPFVLTLRFGAAPLGRLRLAITFASKRFLDLPLDVQRVVLTEPGKRNPADRASLDQALARMPAKSAEVARVEKEIRALESKVATTLILRPSAQPRPTHVQKRGDFLNLGEAVEPGTFGALPALAIASRQANRLDLAHWLTSSENPLTARVVVNRMWQQFFGRGIVETENDFGIQGSPPTHAELLDWLAVEIQKGGWDLKRMHRLLVTSAAYRQSSHMRDDLRARDPDNRLVGRQQRLRLEAEIVRDAALCTSGLLDRRIGGPSVYPPQPPEVFAFTQNKHPWPESKGRDRYRRGLYTFIWRQSQHPLLATFDAPDAQTACTRRNRSDTPLQALHLANDPAFVEFAHGLAARLPFPLSPRGRGVEGEGADDFALVAYAFRCCLARPPDRSEADRLVRFLREQRRQDPSQATVLLARVLLNLDEFITRE
jgi:hypothetical protein